MKTTLAPKRKKRTVPLPLKVTAIVLTQAELTLLSQLAQEQSDLLGRAISRSTAVRGVLRLVQEKITPSELRDAIEIELKQGRHWGQDSTKPPAGGGEGCTEENPVRATARRGRGLV